MAVNEQRDHVPLLTALDRQEPRRVMGTVSRELGTFQCPCLGHSK